MRKLIALLSTILCVSFSLLAQSTDDRVKLPDFAYPQDVIKTAQALIKSRSADERVLGALELWNAKAMIDNESTPESMKYIVSLSDSEKDPAVKALLKLMAAEMANRFKYYDSKVNSYFDNEETFEIQRNQLNSVISSLLKEAMAIAPPTPLTEFRNALDWNEIGLSVLPTVRDFVAWHAVQADNKLLDDALKTIGEDSPAYFALIERFKRSSKTSYDSILKMLDNPASAYALYLYINNLSYSNRERLSTKTLEQQYEFLTKAKAKVAGLWVETTVDNRIKYLESPYFKVSYKSDCPVNKFIPINIKGFNLDDLKLSIYSFDSESEALKADNSPTLLKSLTPTFEKDYRLSHKMSGEEVVDSLQLPAGYYVVTASSNENFHSSGTLNVYPWLFVRLEKDWEQWIQVLDVATGAPVKDLNALTRKNTNKPFTDTGLLTDSKGCVLVPYNRDTQIGFRDGKAGKIFVYKSDIGSRLNSLSSNETEPNYRHKITTDRPIYRPGETVRMLLTIISDDEAIENRKISTYVYLPRRANRSNSGDSDNPIEVKFGPTDKFGRSTAELKIPDDTELGSAYISTDSKYHYYYIGYFDIAEFKLNDLKIIDLTSELTGDSIIMKGKAVNEAGMGLSNIEIYGSVDYDMSLDNDVEPFTFNTVSGQNGLFCVRAPRYYSGNVKSWSTEEKSEDDSTDEYEEDDFDVTVLDEDDLNFGQNNVSQTQDADETFKATFDLDAMSPNGRYANNHVRVDMEYPYCIDRFYMKSWVDRTKGLTFKLDISGVNHPDEATWSIINFDDKTTVLSGTAKIGTVSISPSLLKQLKVGKYILSVEMDNKKALSEYIGFVLYDQKDNCVPSTKPFVVLDNHLTGTDSQITVGIPNDNTYLWVNYPDNPDSEADGLKSLRMYKLNNGWHRIPVPLSGYNCSGTVEVKLYAVDTDASIENESAWITVNPVDSLTLSCESFRDKLTAGAKEKWQFVVKRNKVPAQAAIYLNMMNSKLTPFLRHGLPLSPGVGPRVKMFSDFFIDSYQRHNNYYNSIYSSRNSNYKILPFIKLPIWRNIFAYQTEDFEEEEENEVLMDDVASNMKSSDLVVVGYGTTKKANYTGSVATALDRAVPGLTVNYGEEAVNEESVEVRCASSLNHGSQIYGYRSPSALMEVELREPKVYTALWEPMLVTGEDGRVDVEFTVPGETTGWELFAEAWTTDLLSARLSHSFTASKPLIVAPNPPRFVRVGDRVNLVSAVTNATDSAMTVSVLVNVLADSVSLADVTTELALAAGETRFVNTPVSVDVTGGELVYTVRASNGVTGDGERNAIPVLASSALVTESRNFYINPGQADFSTRLPQAQGTDFASELHFTANPMWTVVEALPKAIEPWCKAATALAMSVYTSNTALELNKRFPEAKDVIDITNTRKVAETSLEALGKLQAADGGFKWGEWADGPDRYSTLAVLDWLADQKDRPEVADIIEPALRYVDKTAVGKDGKVAPDFLYTTVRSFYGRPDDQNGARVVNATIKDIIANWKKFSIDQKALAIIALNNYGYQKVARTILGSLEQFGRPTADRGFEFPNMLTILAYSHTLEAFTAMKPESAVTQGLVQHLLYIRQGMDWGSSAFTSYAVKSLMSAAPTWVTKAAPVNVTVDGKPVDTSSVGMAGVVNTPVEGSELTIVRPEASTPAYGAIVSTFVAPLTDLKPFSDGEVTIAKTIVRDTNGSQQVLGASETVTPGERLKVIVHVKTSRPLSNLVITDNRPAAFEPVVQVPRMVWSRSAGGYYLENRDTLTNIYIGYLPRGAFEFEYEVTVNNTGTFTTGMATITSAIAPELTAHSGSSSLTLAPAK